MRSGGVSAIARQNTPGPTVEETETADWRGRMGELVDAVVAAEAELISELGSETEATVIAN
jgi:hypothetical protein